MKSAGGGKQATLKFLVFSNGSSRKFFTSFDRVVWGNSGQHGAIRDRAIKTSFCIHLLIQVLKHPMCKTFFKH